MIALALSLLLTTQEPAADAEFLRRITLDLAGTIPTADQARAFLADADPAKREKLIDRLLASPDYARRMEQAITVMFLLQPGMYMLLLKQNKRSLKKNLAVQ